MPESACPAVADDGLGTLQVLEPAESSGGSATCSDDDVRAQLRLLAAGSTRWLCENRTRFERSECWPSTTLRVKACIELGLLNRFWQRSKPDDPARQQVVSTLRLIWPDPGFIAELEAGGAEVKRFRLGYAALAPDGLADDIRLAVLASMAPQGHLVGYGKAPEYRLENRYFAELAGLTHSYESYQDLYRGTLLAQPPEQFDLLATYVLAHVIFHLTDFGYRPMDVPADDLVRIREQVIELTQRYTDLENRDITAELVLCQSCLGLDPTRTASGKAGIGLLRNAQRSDGAMLKRPDQEPSGIADEYFVSAYHATLVVGLVSLILLRAPVN